MNDRDGAALFETVKRRWMNEPEFRKAWRGYMLKNARAKGYPDFYGVDNVWTPIEFEQVFGTPFASYRS